MSHDIEKLPKWAQQLIANLDESISDKLDEIARLRAAHSLLTDREWFTIPGPSFEDNEDVLALYRLYNNGAQCICTLARGDVLLIGRNTKKHEPRV